MEYVGITLDKKLSLKKTILQIRRKTKKGRPYIFVEKKILITFTKKASHLWPTYCTIPYSFSGLSVYN